MTDKEADEQQEFEIWDRTFNQTDKPFDIEEETWLPRKGNNENDEV